MKAFQKFLDIFIGVTALVVIAGLILSAFNIEYSFMDSFLSNDMLLEIIGYLWPILIGVVCIRFASGKIVWFILTIVFVGIALWIHFDTSGFFAFIHSIFG